MSIGTRMEELRKKRGFSRAQMQKKTGISAQRIYKYENDKARIPADILPTLCNALQCEVEELLDSPTELNGNTHKAYYKAVSILTTAFATKAPWVVTAQLDARVFAVTSNDGAEAHESKSK